MDYHYHYDALMTRAKTRKLSGYFERHHVVPRCLGGADDANNLVELTPEEHYLAHQLLIKMYPDHEGLVWAAYKMTWNSNKGRINNKLYGWVKRKYHKVCKDRVQEKNPSYGASWWSNPYTGESTKLKVEDVPTGWVKGRNIKIKQCPICGVDHYLRRITCSEKCRRESLRAAGKERDPVYKVKLSNSQIIKIIEKNKKGISLQTIANEYNINKWTIYDIVTRYKKQHGV
jgi:hypothetical protein